MENSPEDFDSILLGISEAINEYTSYLSYYSQVNSIFTEDEFERIIEVYSRHIRFPDIRLVKDGANLSQEEYTSAYTKSRFIKSVTDSDKIWKAFSSGHTIVINAINNLNEGLFDFTRTIERRFSCEANVNCYFSPPNAAGFPSHYDLHDVIIIQVCGGKDWFIADPTIRYPLKNDHFSKHIPPNDYQNIRLKVGNILYIPRGMWHYARTSDRNSLHLTIGLHKSTNFDTISEFIDVLGEYECLRYALESNTDRERHMKLLKEKALPEILRIFEKDM